MKQLEKVNNISNNILRGIEREGLRVDRAGALSNTPHPKKLGSALTNKKITTDYSESLLEIITETHSSIDSLLKESANLHRFVYASIGEEILWQHSMPPLIMPDENKIPIAWYGKSNLGLFKHIYRKGLASRYGRMMQCIAGIHYNFSINDVLWQALKGDSEEVTGELKSIGYSGLIRNFIRYSWIILYLFGSSPVVSRTFSKSSNTYNLEALDADTLCMPYATSLRMSDLGYQSKVQQQLGLYYNDLPTFIEKINKGLTTSWPEYEKIGTYTNQEWLQLNTNILQIENEYYSSIRPKCNSINGERPIHALNNRGIEYIEVRCLDIDITSNLGISKNTCLFMDAFLLFCVASNSPFFQNSKEYQDYHNNFDKVAIYGRKPNLLLNNNNTNISLKSWGKEIIDRIKPYSILLDQNNSEQLYLNSLKEQLRKINDPELTPSSSIINTLKKEKISLHEYILEMSKSHYLDSMQLTLDTDIQKQYQYNSTESIKLQKNIEEKDNCNFKEYLSKQRI